MNPDGVDHSVKFDDGKENCWRNPKKPANDSDSSRIRKLAGPAESRVRHSTTTSVLDGPTLDEESLGSFNQLPSERNVSTSNISGTSKSVHNAIQIEANMSTKCISECDSTTDHELDLTSNSPTTLFSVVSTASVESGGQQHCVASEVDSTTDVPTTPDDATGQEHHQLPSVLQTSSKTDSVVV